MITNAQSLETAAKILSRNVQTSVYAQLVVSQNTILISLASAMTDAKNSVIAAKITSMSVLQRKAGAWDNVLISNRLDRMIAIVTTNVLYSTTAAMTSYRSAPKTILVEIDVLINSKSHSHVNVTPLAQNLGIAVWTTILSASLKRNVKTVVLTSTTHHFHVNVTRDAPNSEIVATITTMNAYLEHVPVDVGTEI